VSGAGTSGEGVEDARRSRSGRGGGNGGGGGGGGGAGAGGGGEGRRRRDRQSAERRVARVGTVLRHALIGRAGTCVTRVVLGDARVRLFVRLCGRASRQGPPSLMGGVACTTVRTRDMERSRCSQW